MLAHAPVQAEEWVSVPGFPGYRIRVDGRVMSPFGHVLAEAIGSHGYPFVQLQRDKKNYTRTVHGLLMAAFVGPRPPGMEVCHADDDKLNYSLKNLRYDTPSANKHDAVRNGRNYNAKKNACKRGHSFSGPNLVVVASGRVCRACRGAWRAGSSEAAHQARADIAYARLMREAA